MINYLAKFKEGVEAWNQWRKDNPDIKPRLSNIQNLHYILIEDSIDLSGFDFSNSYLSNSRFTYARLANADLSGADLSGANLFAANLSNANLFRVNLREVNAIHTRFCGANLSCICIEDWHINSKTDLKTIRCDYIYLNEIYSEEEEKWIFTERRPHTGNFKDGEFTQLFKKASETVDLIFSEGIDWQAFLVSFNKLQIECDSEELSINSFENKGNGAFVIRVNVPDGADKAEIEKYLKKQYQLEATVEAQQRELTNLYDVVKLLAGRATTENHNTYNVEKAGIVHSDNSNISGDAKIAGELNENPNPQD